jgi:hypothetical protein
MTNFTSKNNTPNQWSIGLIWKATNHETYTSKGNGHYKPCQEVTGWEPRWQEMCKYSTVSRPALRPAVHFVFFPEDEAAGAWSWLLTSLWYRGQEMHTSAPSYVFYVVWCLISYVQGQLCFFLLQLVFQGQMTSQFTVDGRIYLYNAA